MNTSTITQTEQPNDGRHEPAGPSSHESRAPRRRLRALLGIAAGVGTVAVVAIVGLAANGDGTDDRDAVEAPGTVLELSTGSAESLASCLVFDVAYLRDMSPAFAATATEVEGELVVLHVDRWHAGDAPASTVELHAPGGLEALTGGFPVEVGQQYLITAADGVVNYCGYSGPATPELTAAYDTAFGS